MKTTVDIEGNTIFALSDLATGPLSELANTPLAALLDGLFFTQAAIKASDRRCQAHVTVVREGELLVSPFGDIVDIVIGGIDGLSVFDLKYFVIKQNDFVRVLVSLVDLPLSLRISANILRPLTPGTNQPDCSANNLDISLGTATLSYDSSEGVDLNFTGNIVLPRCMIGDSGVLIEASNIRPIYSPSDIMPTGLDESFRGVFIESARIYLPEGLPELAPDDLAIANCSIGSGGFSGRISGNWLPQLASDNKSFTGKGAGDIFGIPFALKEVALEFKQNTFVESKIEGTLILPFFDQPVVCTINLTNDSDFTVALSADQTLPPGITAPKPTDDGLFVFTKEGLLKLKLKSILFKKEADLFSIQLGGDIKPLFGGIDWPEVEVKALTIDSKGHVSIDGGWIEIPKQKTLDFHGFKLELTKIGFGKEADGSRWIGLSGGINIVEGIPLKGGVDGLKIIWKDINDIRLQISGINIAFEISDILKFDGVVFFIDEPNKKGIKGGVKMIIYPLGGMMIDVQFMAGRNTLAPPFNFFYLYIGSEFPAGIPIGQTGAFLYGLAGLFGYNVYPNKGLPPHEGEAWFEDENGNAGWYKRDIPGISGVEKWTDSRDCLALGGGLTLGTADNGFTFSGKVLLVVLIPGPMILVEGKAQFLRERKGLDEDPIFRLLAVLDAKSGTFLMNIEAKYVFPPGSGLLVDISGSAEAYFNFNNPNAWHLYLGQETPESKRILAKILSLYYAEAFFMLDAGGVRLGVRAGYNADWKFGPLRVVLQALVEGALGLGTKPTQAYGALSLLGNVELKAFGKGIGLEIYTGISAQAPTPWYIRGEFSVKLKLPWPLPDPEATIVLEWREETEPPIPIVLAKIGIEHLKVTEKWELQKFPIYDSDNDGFMDGQGGESNAVWVDSPVVPLDARPVLTFSRPVQDVPLIGNNSSGVPPTEQIADYQYNFRLKRVFLEKMEKFSASPWILVADKSEVSANGALSLYGDWQIVPNSSQLNSKLMVWSNTPFDIARELESNESFLYSILDSWSGYPCNIDTFRKKIHVDFEELKVRLNFFPVFLHDDFLFVSETSPMIIMEYNAEWLGTKHGLSPMWSNPKNLEDGNLKDFLFEDIKDSKQFKGMWIILPELMRVIEVHFSIGTRIEFEAYSESGILIVNGNVTVPECSANSSVRNLFILDKPPNDPIRSIHITGAFIILKIECISDKEWNRVDQNKRIMEHNKTATVEHWGLHEGAYLEPNKYYRLSVVTETERIRSDGSTDFFEFNEHAYFQTVNPPGAYEALHSTVEPNNTPQAGREYGSTEHYPHGGPLKDLSPYIKYTIPGQQVISSNEIKQAASNEPQRPAYRSYDIGVAFNEPRGYVEAMYLMADLPLKIKLYDNNAVPAIDVSGNPIELDNLWGDNPEIVITREENQWAATLDASTCNVTIDKTAANYSSNLYSGSIEMALKPSTFYKAILYGGMFPVYKFNFITSRFCTFIHHIHSFKDAAWDFHKLLGSPDTPLLTDDEQSQLENILTSGIEESIKHEQIMSLFELGVRQLPEQVEILTLNDSQKSYGLLLESPEPFDWERVESFLKYSSSHEIIEESLNQIKIIDADISVNSQLVNDEACNEEYVDILVIEQLNVSDCKIQHKKIGEEGYSDYYEFKDEEDFSAGTVIRIHSGKKSSYNQPENEQKHRFRLLDEDVNAWQFNSDGEIIQIIDGSGNVLYRRTFFPYEDERKDIHIIRSKDQTRAFIFVPDDEFEFSDLPDGRYCLNFKYNRHVNDEMPVLKRSGLENSEETYIEFSLPSALPE